LKSPRILTILSCTRPQGVCAASSRRPGKWGNSRKKCATAGFRASRWPGRELGCYIQEAGSWAFVGVEMQARMIGVFPITTDPRLRRRILASLPSTWWWWPSPVVAQDVGWD